MLIPGSQFLKLQVVPMMNVNVGISVGMTLIFLAVCLAAVWWIFKTGCRLKA